ncbi:hypothetical protein FRC14_004537 [Serendipita sp. 396]|nr:hypothetical protein FRC14_004537 [Serendipita sp. 396]KAG8865798.1 hypothetical protein FRC20_009483 [Serendipita sp. 405]
MNNQNINLPTLKRSGLTCYYMETTHANTASLLHLPGELLLCLLQYLDYDALLALSITCRIMYQIIHETGWKDFCRATYRETPSVAERWSSLTWRQRAKEAHLTNERWNARMFVAKTLNSRWSQKHRPEIALSRSRLAVACGHAITTYRFGCVEHGIKSSVTLEGTFTVFPPVVGNDITGLSFIEDGGKDESLLVSNCAGDLVRIRLPLNEPLYQLNIKDKRKQNFPAIKTAQYQIPRIPLGKIAAAGSEALVLASEGSAFLVNPASPWKKPICTTIGTTAWAAHLELRSSTAYAAIGTSKNVVVHPVIHSSISSSPIAILGGTKKDVPVYCVAQFLPGGSPDIIASGWYDGRARVHDLRCSIRAKDATSASMNSPTPLEPVLTLADPWHPFDPVYSIASRAQIEDATARSKGSDQGMPHQGSFLIAGSAIHSAISIWDVRQPSRSWSMFAPGKDWSPVYALKAEGSRLWGATQWRAFAIDFAPDAPLTDYPWNREDTTSSEITYPHVAAQRRNIVVDLDDS